MMLAPGVCYTWLYRRDIIPGSIAISALLQFIGICHLEYGKALTAQSWIANVWERGNLPVDACEIF